jgi:hypothetical protein
MEPTILGEEQRPPTSHLPLPLAKDLPKSDLASSKSRLSLNELNSKTRELRILLLILVKIHLTIQQSNARPHRKHEPWVIACSVGCSFRVQVPQSR